MITIWRHLAPSASLAFVPVDLSSPSVPLGLSTHRQRLYCNIQKWGNAFWFSIISDRTRSLIFGKIEGTLRCFEKNGGTPFRSVAPQFKHRSLAASSVRCRWSQIITEAVRSTSRPTKRSTGRAKHPLRRRTRPSAASTSPVVHPTVSSFKRWWRRRRW